ncbi:MAG: helix-turn-helix domain-containing protein [Janthinobacterium lividum]
MTVREMVLQDKAVRVGPLAKETGVSAATLYNLIRQNKIPCIRIGRSVVVPPHGARPLLGIEPAQAA